MLCKLKAHPVLKAVPVLMLTAEGGRDNIIKIAKLGVRDYVVKPFKEEILVQKIGRIIDLKSIADVQTKPKSIFDPAVILVVEDKPLIIAQIQSGLKHTPWKVQSVASAEAAMEFCKHEVVDLVIISLSLAEEAAFVLFRQLRGSHQTKYTPIMALVVKTDAAIQQQAQQLGFTFFITKPIDVVDLESKAAKAMRLDTSQRYFRVEPELIVVQLPDNCPTTLINEISEQLKVQVAAAVNAGINRAVFDLLGVRNLDVGHIRLVLSSIQICRDLSFHFALVGTGNVVKDSQGYEDTRTWEFFATVEEARASFKKADEPAAEPAPAAEPVPVDSGAEPVHAWRTSAG
jgi:two-component system cell cycle response regulator